MKMLFRKYSINYNLNFKYLKFIQQLRYLSVSPYREKIF